MISQCTVLSTRSLFWGRTPPRWRNRKWFAGKPELEYFGLALASDTEAYGGHVCKARELTKRSVDSAVRADNKEGGAIYLANSALQQPAHGNTAQARPAAAEAPKLAPVSHGV